jgi:hypothetical protein
VGERTVAHALAAARDLGLVNWTERRIRRGWRWLRTSNACKLTNAPAGDVQRAARPAFPRYATTCQRGGEGRVRPKRRCWNVMPSAAAMLPDLLARRRREIEDKLLGNSSCPSAARSGRI